MPKKILYLGLDPKHYAEQGEIVHCPLIHIVPRSLSDPTIFKALQNFEHYSHVVITSKSTVVVLNDYLFQMGIHADIWKNKITLAVGQVTASHLQKHGITPFKIAQEETAEGVIYELQQISLADAHLFFPHSAKARTVIHDFLKTKKIRHTTCALYDTQIQVPQYLPRLEEFDEVIFTSPSTVDAFLSVFGSFPNAIKLTAIGPITAKYLADTKNLKHAPSS